MEHRDAGFRAHRLVKHQKVTVPRHIEVGFGQRNRGHATPRQTELISSMPTNTDQDTEAAVGRHSQTSDDDDKSTETETDTDSLDSDTDNPSRSSKADEFWEKVGVEPIEVALPKGVGLTLRAYRMSDEIELDSDEASDDEAGKDSEDDELDTEPAEATDSKPAKSKSKSKAQDSKAKDDDEDESSAEDLEPAASDSDSDDEDSDAKDGDEADLDEEAEDDEEEDEDEEAEPETEEVPVFLSDRGSLPLFETAEALVEYVKSDAPTDLATIDTWDELVAGIKAEYVVAADEDRYELDLVVENLRGGHDTWDPELLIGAGELARDLGYALRVTSIMSTLSHDSPLDKLDNSLRSMAEGGMRAIFARRKARKVGAQQTSLAWRGIINKISESVDWRN